MTTVIDNPAPLKTHYLPLELVGREDEAAEITASLSTAEEVSSRNLHLHGLRGTGKTHLIHRVLENLSSQLWTCYIDCRSHDTEYKVLNRIYEMSTQEEVKPGLHSSDLQRKVEKRIGANQTVLVLDEIDFLLLNDGDSLLYFLSRIENSDALNIITISPNRELPIEERIQSSLQPRDVPFSKYDTGDIHEILLQRARKAFFPRTLEKGALNYIASEASNPRFGLHWLRTASENASQAVTQETVESVRDSAIENYIDEMLKPFSHHHRLVFEAIERLSKERLTHPSGSIYQKYEELGPEYEVETLSQRRISDFLKQLELLDLIDAEYHYGGRKGKTREITLKTR